jgi:hypothetical protein
MYYLVNVDHNCMAVHLTRSDCEWSKAVDLTDDILCSNSEDEDSDADW